MPLGIIKKIGRKLRNDGDEPTARASEKRTESEKPGNAGRSSSKPAGAKRQRRRKGPERERKIKVSVLPGSKSSRNHGEEWAPGGGDSQSGAKRSRNERESGSKRDEQSGSRRRGGGDRSRMADQQGAKDDSRQQSREKRGSDDADKPRRNSKEPRSRSSESRSRNRGKPEKQPMGDWAVEDFKVPAVEGKVRFHDLDLPIELMRAIAELNFEYCTPIQAQSLKHSLAGKNVAGQAQTGTGKTAAFLIAVLSRFLRDEGGRPDAPGTPRALIIAPTRELVIQIAQDAQALGRFCHLRCMAVYGGMDYNRQQRELTEGGAVDLVVATPGRLLDFRRNRIVDLSQVNTLVIDEADRMLDMGFIPDVRRIVSFLPHRDKRCTTLYSATLNDAVMRLASQWMPDPVIIKVEPEQVAVDTVKQLVYTCRSAEKFALLYNLVMRYSERRILVFCNRRIGAQIAADRLERRGVKCALLSGSVAQKRRLNVLEDFREGKIRVVVATDVAGRGIHVDDIGFVINYDFPYEAEDYVHRIGRTGRAGAEGTAVSFACEDESFIIPEIEKFIKEELKCVQPEESLLRKPPKAHRPPAKRHNERRDSNYSRGGARGGPRRDGRRSGGRRPSGGDRQRRSAPRGSGS